MTQPRTPGLGEAFGLEVELMLVDPDTLDVRPVADQLLAEGGPPGVCDVEDGLMGWSNELVLHLVEVKNDRPVPSLAGLEREFDRSLVRLRRAAAAAGVVLLPGGVHPWMDPAAETVIWPHAYSEVYGTYDRLFDCRRHGWANLQATHLNLSFDGEEQFARLHAAARLVLALIPALAASSPVQDGRVTGALDARVLTYRDNSRRLPSMTGRVIPEPSRSPAAYRADVLEPLWRDLREIEPEGVLQGEFANARGAIPRFERSAIEVRLIDAQECSRADVAVSALVAHAIDLLVHERHLSFDEQFAWPTEPLIALLDATSHAGPDAALDDPALAAAFGAREATTAGDLWRTLLADAGDALHPDHAAALGVIVEQGTLAQRLLARLPARPTRDDLRRTWRPLVDCHARDRLLGEGDT